MILNYPEWNHQKLGKLLTRTLRLCVIYNVMEILTLYLYFKHINKQCKIFKVNELKLKGHSQNPHWQLKVSLVIKLHTKQQWENKRNINLDR